MDGGRELRKSVLVVRLDNDDELEKNYDQEDFAVVVNYRFKIKESKQVRKILRKYQRTRCYRI